MKNKSYPLNEVIRINNLKELVDLGIKTNDQDLAFVTIEKTSMVKVNYRKLKSDIDGFGTWLYKNGLKGSKIAIVGENSYYWILSYLAIANGNSIVVPIDKELSISEKIELIERTGCDAVIFSSNYEDIAEELKKRENIHINYLVNMRQIPNYVSIGLEYIANDFLEYVNHIIDNDCVMTIVFTSGTTGISKGVMLSHKNIMSDTYAAYRHCLFSGESLLVLPLHHTFGLIAGVFGVMLYGYAVFINKSLKYLANDFQKAKPQNMALVPLFIEDMYEKINQTIKSEKKGVLIKSLIIISNVLILFGIDIRKKIFAPILKFFGGNLEVIVCGGAPLEKKYIKYFRNFGIDLLNGYGITECSPVVSVNRNSHYRDGSVGQCLSECSVKIDEPNEKGEGEICVKGSIVMLGYYKMEEETRKVIKDRWFSTGDIGYIDKDGFLFITGRKKNLIVLSNGENVSPEEIESIIKKCILIKEVIVFEKDKLICAEVFPNYDLAKERKISNLNEILKEEINKINKNLPIYKQINKIIFRENEFLKTTTKKIIRNNSGGNESDKRCY